ncbi:MAG: VWA domain-containing protein, partial [Armatimonadota bacterium]
KRVTGAVLEKDKARQTYEDIVRKMRDPALLEYVGRNLFKASVFPVPPKGDTRIQIEYSEVVPLDSGICKYVYPLNTEKFSPDPIKDVSVGVTIESRIPIKAVYSPTHDTKLAVDRKSDTHVAASFEESDVRPDKDFVIYYTLSQQDFGLGLITHRQKGEDGYFLLMLAPKHELQEREIAAKDVVFVFDTSGSMARDNKIQQARDALQLCLANLNAEDRFNIVTFSTGVKAFRKDLVSADLAKSDEAKKFIDNVKAVGGTNIGEALLTSLAMFDGQKRPRIVVFLTDGQPTVGETDEGAIIASVDDANQYAHGGGPGKAGVRIAATEAKGLAPGAGARVFVFGVGHDVNTHLLDKLAGENGGVPQYVEPEEDIELKVSSFYNKMSYPVLSDIAIDFGKVNVHNFYPTALPDLFKGSQLRLFGRYEGDGHLAVKLLGRLAGKDREFAFDASFPEEEQENEFVARLWASRRIGYLLDAIRLKGENEELKGEVIALSVEYGILTPYTSSLVTEDKELAARSAPVLAEVDRLSRAVAGEESEDEEGFSALGSGRGGYGGGGYRFRRAPAGPAGARGDAGAPETVLAIPSRRQAGAAMRSKSGRWAVDAAAEVAGMKDASEIAPYGGARGVKRVAGHTFYFDGQVWYDRQYKRDMKTYKIKSYGEAYFKLLEARTAWGKLFAVGERVAIVFGDTCLMIGDDGAETLTATELKQIAALDAQSK